MSDDSAMANRVAPVTEEDDQLAALPPHTAWRLPAHAAGIVAVLAGAVVALLFVDRAALPILLPAAIAWWAIVVAVVRSDLAHFIIPDAASLGIALLGLAQIAGTTMLAGAGRDVLVLECAAVIRGLAAFVLFWTLGRLCWRFGGRDALGFGDVKLAAASALWLEPGDAAMALEIAALAAIAVLLIRARGRSIREIAMPFGAFLAPAAWIVFVTAPALHSLLDLLP